MEQDWTDKLREKMESYEEQPSGALWDGIADASGHRRRWLVPGMAAAAALLAGAFLAFRLSDRSPSAPAVAEIREDHDHVNAEVAETSAERHAAVADMPVRHLTAMNTAVSSPAEHLVAMAAENGIEETAADTYMDTESVGRKENAVESQTDGKETDSSIDLEKERQFWAQAEAEDMAERRHSSKGRISAGLSAAGAGSKNVALDRPTGAVMGANPLESSFGAADFMDAEFKKNNSMLVYNQPEVEIQYSHKIPVKIGVSVRYGLTERLGIESGVTYSLLSSDIRTGERGSSGGWSKGEQTLHYIGVPLNMTYSFVDSRWFDAYLSAGGMVEKSVKGYLETDEFLDGKRISSHHTALTPKELQWSVNAAAGAQVRIIDHLGLFVEPGVSYRFRSGSRIRSIYTDKPFDFSLGFGIRVDF